LDKDNICDSEKKEAEAAFEAYVFHWGKVYNQLLDAKCKEMLNETSKSEDNSSKLNILDGGLKAFAIRDTASLELNPIEAQINSLTIPFTDKVEFVPVPDENVNLKRATNSNIQTAIMYNMDEFKSYVVISHFQTETVADFVGVLISGLRLKLLNANGDVKMVDFF
jgi:hypothetical protein